MAENRELWAFSEKPALLAELIGGARSLAGDLQSTVTVVVLGPYAEVDRAFAWGAERVIWMGEQKPGYQVEDYVPTLAEVIRSQKPYGVLIGSTVRGKVIAGRLAARLGQTVITDVKQFLFEGDNLQAQHLIFGGGAVRVEQPRSEPVLATVGPGVFEAPPAEAGRSGEVFEAPFVEPEQRLILRERKTRPAATVNLAAAKKVVCPGRGVAQKEDLGMVEELARALGAEIGCTRPLAEGLDWLPRERYIGISGANIKPQLYLGVGVSGQVQHTVGMADSRVVVAINKDSNAPIFAQSDYGIVGDLYTIVPALIQALKSRR